MFAPSLEAQLDQRLLQDQIHQGIVPRACRKLFEAIEEDSSAMEYGVQLSLFELYNEKLYDLFCPKRMAVKHPDELTKLRSSLNLRQSSGDIFVDGATAQTVTTYEEAMVLVAQACSIRATAGTASNDYSSRWDHLACPVKQLPDPRSDARSHMLVLLTVNKYCPQTFKTLHSQFYLCDLAGSERQHRTEVDGDRCVAALCTGRPQSRWLGFRLKEACSINRSLLALGKVIHVLAHPANGDSSAHVPYRDSKLTRLLQNAFGGNGRTALICTVSSEAIDFREGLSTLQFGDRASRISNTLSQSVTMHSVPVRCRCWLRAKPSLTQSPTGAQALAAGCHDRDIELEGRREQASTRRC